MKLGQKVKCTKQYVRHFNGDERKWEAETIEPIEGIITGIRTLQDGRFNLLDDEFLSDFVAYHFKKAYLVVTNINRNAMKVPPYAIFKIVEDE